MRELLVFGEKTFKISIPAEAKITFGPWSPPGAGIKTVSYERNDRALSGTLRVYENAKAGASVLAVFSGVSGYRDTSLGYAEEVAVEQGATIWKTDDNGYQRSDRVKRASKWVTPQLTDGKKKRPGKKAEEKGNDL